MSNDIELHSLDLAELTVRIDAEFDIDILADVIVNTIGEIKKKSITNEFFLKIQGVIKLYHGKI